MRNLLKSAYRAIPWKVKIFQVLRRFPIPESLFKHLHFTGPFAVAVTPFILSGSIITAIVRITSCFGAGCPLMSQPLSNFGGV
jgi:hypothetical protein